MPNYKNNDCADCASKRRHNYFRIATKLHEQDTETVRFPLKCLANCRHFCVLKQVVPRNEQSASFSSCLCAFFEGKKKAI